MCTVICDMSDLDTFKKMLDKGCQDYAHDEFYGANRVMVKSIKFNNWMGMLTNTNGGVLMTIIYMFDKKGNYVTSSVSVL